MWRRNPIASNRDSICALFREGGDDMARVASLLERLLREWWARREITTEIRRCAQHGSRVTHDLRCELHRGVGLPFECEDALALASALEDVLEHLEEAAELVVIYKVGAAPAHVTALATLIRKVSRELAAAVRVLDRPARLGDVVEQIQWLERDATRTLRAARSSLFWHETDASLVLRWKDILDRLEHAIDGCHDGARDLETIRVKYSGPGLARSR